jgi:ATP-dependent DNA helicase PIF1
MPIIHGTKRKHPSDPESPQATKVPRGDHTPTVTAARMAAVLTATSSAGSVMDDDSSVWVADAPATPSLTVLAALAAAAAAAPKHKAAVPAAAIVLSETQESVPARLERGDAVVCVLGVAGSGKSETLRATVRRLRAMGKVVAITASTGVAAEAIGGTTLHAFASVGLFEYAPKTMMRKLKSRGTKRAAEGCDNWLMTDVLVVDEISMVDAGFFTKLAELARLMRTGTSAGHGFGGMQLLLMGDFLQLPPVKRRDDPASSEEDFVFQSKEWRAFVPIASVIEFTRSFRQPDPTFALLLDEIRMGVVSPETLAAINRDTVEKGASGAATPAEKAAACANSCTMYCTNKKVDADNDRRLGMIPTAPGSTEVFIAVDSGEESHLPALQKECRAPARLILKADPSGKRGACVMCVRNIPELGLVNGSVGTVVGYTEPATAVAVAGTSVAVAKAPKRLPIVRYPVPGGTPEQYFDVTMPIVNFTREVRGVVKAKREMVPLKLSWAATIHKAQGATLNRVRIDFARPVMPGTYEPMPLEYGAAYVALSRVRYLEGVTLVRALTADDVRAHPAALDYYRRVRVAAAAAATAKKLADVQSSADDKSVLETGRPTFLTPKSPAAVASGPVGAAEAYRTALARGWGG